MKKKEIRGVNISNKRAHYDYIVCEEFTAGISLLGSEVKSIKQNKASIAEAYCYVKQNEMWIKNMHISFYENSRNPNHEEKRERRLLLKKKEINRIIKKKDKGKTIVPLKVLTKKGLIKIIIALVKGKKNYDKRVSIREREMDLKLRKNVN